MTFSALVMGCTLSCLLASIDSLPQQEGGDYRTIPAPPTLPEGWIEEVGDASKSRTPDVLVSLRIRNPDLVLRLALGASGRAKARHVQTRCAEGAVGVVLSGRTRGTCHRTAC